jgi:alanine racemase
LRRLFAGVPASLANSSGIFMDGKMSGGKFLGSKIHFDLVRAGGALLGINPTPGAANPMRPVLELTARIVQVRTLNPGEIVGSGVAAKRRMRVAWVSLGFADGYPRPPSPPDGKLQVLVGGARCPVAAAPSMDLLPVDVTDLADASAARFGAMVTIFGGELGVSELGAAARTTAADVLGRLGQRFHRIYYAI